MNIKIITIPICILAGISLVIAIGNRNPSHQYQHTIGIIQTASHPALDAAREGFVATIKNAMPNTVNIVVHNAQGAIANLHAIAQRCSHDKNIDLIYAIATPAAQAIAALEKTKPIVIVAVTDPTIIGSQQNLGGVTDAINIDKQIEMMMQLTPSVQTVGLLYSTGEPNSLKQVALMKTCLAQNNIDYVEIGITHESDLPLAVATACRKADALLCPTDNTIASGMPIIVKIARDHNKPLYACHNQAVEQGALASRGVDYTQCGAHAGAIALECLAAKHTNNAIPLVNANCHITHINSTTLNHLGLPIPASLTDYHLVQGEAK